MIYILYFLATAVLSSVFTWVVRGICLRYNLSFRPRKRDVHKKPLPRLGGAAIFLSFLLVAGAVFYFIRPDLIHQLTANRPLTKLASILLGGGLITASMLLDDILGLKAWQKLLIQISASLLLIVSGIGIDKIHLIPGHDLNLNSVYIPIVRVHEITYHFSLFSDMLTLVWMVGMMNVINFVDGIDGLAGGLSTIAAVIICLLALQVKQPAIATLAVIVAGAGAGFLVWNFPPAKIFMGDSGSMFLGFMLGVLPLISGGKLATVFLVLGFPILDGLIVALSRMKRGQNPLTTPDKTHLHHRFLDAGFTVRQAVFSMYIVSIAFGWVALRSGTGQKLIAGLSLAILIMVVFLALNWLKDRRKNVSKRSY